MKIDSKQLVSASSIAPYNGRWMFVSIFGQEHPTLKEGAVVMMVCDPKGHNWFLRISDLTLHSLQDKNGAYINLIPAEEVACSK